ncbi:metallophosphoesterase [Pyrobaculum aerophilum]|uniref:metallophosphoesterase n=1 Tax=Pyrobaculum aerophilum TaxID=13773 RepID=UPI0026C38B03|nr:metallophosphoesterase [Pyrobaculum aerophilum]
MYRRALLTMALGLGALAAAGVAVVNTATRILDLGLGRRIVFISDLHLHRVEKYDLPSYDLLLIGGDTYDRNTPGPHVVVETLSQLRGPKVAVLGNHEYWDMRRIPLREGLKALEEAGVHVLRDDWVQIGGLRIYGLDWREDPRAIPLLKTPI